MMIKIMDPDEITQLIFDDDEQMSKYYRLNRALPLHDGVVFIEKLVTFETPNFRYKYEGIEFAVLFDETSDEVVISLDKGADCGVVKSLIERVF